METIRNFLNKISSKEFWLEIRYILTGRGQWLFILAALLLFSYCLHIWYAYIFNPQWPEYKRQEYISSKSKDTALNEKRFDHVIEKIEQRKAESGRKLEGLNDIFRTKK